MKRKFRITRAIDFKRVRRLGKSHTHPLAVLMSAPGENVNSRVGFIVGKSVGNAVKRNRAKRQLRATFTGLFPYIKNNMDMIVIARTPIASASYQEIHEAITQLLNRAELMNPDENDARRPVR